jgi:hypothetical protein
MVETAPADTTDVIHRVLHWAALGCSFIILSSFSLFAVDQLAGASKHQQDLIATDQPTVVVGTPAAKHRGQPRRFIDGAAAQLEAPFTSIVASDNIWVDHMVPALFALAVYGVGLGYLARFSAGLARGVQREKTDPVPLIDQ